MLRHQIKVNNKHNLSKTLFGLEVKNNLVKKSNQETAVKLGFDKGQTYL